MAYKPAPIDVLKRYAQRTEVIEVSVAGWLGKNPRTILFDRLAFTLNSPQFQARIDEQVERWPIMQNIDQKTMFVVRHNDIWHRAVYKCTTPENTILIQLVDSSTALIFNSELNCRLIQDVAILNEPFCRAKCYLFGLTMPDDISPELIEVYDNFFTNTQLTAVVYSEKQRQDCIRYCYFGDFLLQTNEGVVSLRNRLLERRLVSLSTIGLKAWVNIHLEELIDELLNEMNMVPTPIEEEESSTIITELNSKQFLTVEDITNLPDARQHLWLGDFIGQGGFGEVWFGIYKETGVKVAIKGITLNLKRLSLSDNQITNEINILKSLRHKNIIELLNVFTDRKSKLSSKNIIMAFPPADKDLHCFIRSQKDMFGEKVILRIIYQILNGLNHIHNLDIIHRDIKPANILIFPEGETKICDFGLAYTRGQHKMTRIGTKNYMAPEMLLDAYDYDDKVDVWGVGCILAEFMTLQTYFGGHRTHRKLLEYILSLLGTPDDWPELTQQEPQFSKIKGNGICFMYSTEVIELTRRMLVPNPAKRITAKGALNDIEDYFYWFLNCDI